MKIVVDTNVFISGVFFGGKPQEVLEAIVYGRVSGLCSTAILEEYREIVQRMIEKKGGTLNPGFLTTSIPNCNLLRLQLASKNVEIPTTINSLPALLTGPLIMW